MSKNHLITGKKLSPFYLSYILIVFGISGIFWVIGPLVENLINKGIPIDLPLSSLMIISPITATLIIVYKEYGSSGVGDLLRRAFDFRRIENKKWYFVILCIMPSLMLLEYLILILLGRELPKLHWPGLSSLAFIPIFFIAAFFEEIGWQGYLFDHLNERWNALNASMFVGGVWALWHIVPLIQLHNIPALVIWQTVNIFATRILLVWIYQNTGKSLFGSIVFHMMVNVSTVLLPKFGIPYDPAIATPIIIILTCLVGFLLGTENLADLHWNKNPTHKYPSST